MGTKVRDVMTAAPVTLETDRTIVEAARLMRDNDFGNILITKDGILVGVLTDRDIVVRCIAQELDARSMLVSEVCTSDPAHLSPNDDADNAVKLMSKKAVRRIPVLDKGRPVGILSLGDLAVDRDPKSALGRISAAKPTR